VNLDWRRLKAVVLESDDWGLCAWSPDEQARRALADGPAFRSAPGRRYGGSTLESASDVRALADTLLEFRGGDGMPPAWQANTIVASPDYAALAAPLFACDTVPLVDLPATPSRWHRPGLVDAMHHAIDAGVWWPELHGLHHLPETAWLAALRRGEADARRGFEHQCPVCEAVEASGEYDPSEPDGDRDRRLRAAVERFTRLFGRAPSSLCPPDYRWDSRLEAAAAALGIAALQGRAEQHGASLPRVRRAVRRMRWPESSGTLLFMPPRIAFEPCGPEQVAARVGAAPAARKARAAWGAGQPAVISTHRLNYAHLDPRWSEGGRAALRDLLAALAGEGASFLTDAEVASLHARGWSVRPIGQRGALVRHHGVPREPLRIEAPAGVTGVALREGAGEAEAAFDAGFVELRANLGEYILEWRRP
jgi:hypothetical protein